VIFLLTITAWLSSRWLNDWLQIGKGIDSWIALGAIVLLVASNTLSWKAIEKQTDWGVLLLFGGGLALSGVLSETGASAFLARGIAEAVSGYGALLIVLAVVFLMVFLTEVASNTASAALFVPIFYSLGESLPGVTGMALALAVGLAASCAFMLPVATPSNALVFGSGKVPQAQMMRVGSVLNIAAIMVISAFAWAFF